MCVCASASSVAEQLFELSQMSTAPLTDRNFVKFVANNKRPYHVFVLYTARESQYQCSICG